MRVEAAPENLATAEGPASRGSRTSSGRTRRSGSCGRCGAGPTARSARSLGRGARRRRPALEKARRADGPQSVLYYSGERHEGAPQRLRPGLLAPLRRLHDDLRRPLLARGARGDAPDARRQHAQRAVGPRERAARRPLGQERRRDERPPDGAPPRGARERGRRSSWSTRGAPRPRSAPTCSSSSAPAPTARSRSRSATCSSATAASTARSSTRHVLGFDDYAALVAEWTPERAAAVTGVPVVARSRSWRAPRHRSTPRRSSPASACSASRTRARRCARCSPCSRSPDRSAGRAPAGCTRTCRRRSSRP